MSGLPFAPFLLLVRRLTWLVLGLLALGSVLGAGWGAQRLYQQREAQFRHQAEAAVQAINLLQARNLADWRRRQLADAAQLSEDPLLAQAAQQWLARPQADAGVLLQERLRSLLERGGYSAAVLLDAQGRQRLSPEGAQVRALPSLEQQALAQAWAQAEPVCVELYQAQPGAAPVMGLMAPLFDGVAPVAALWLQIDVRASLYPQLRSWPITSPSAESLLLQRTPPLQYLSPLRQAPAGAWLQPLQVADSVAVRALQGQHGSYYGQDYRGQAVLAAASSVPGTPWVLLSKIDEQDALASAQRNQWLLWALLCSLGLLSAGVAAALWQWRARQHVAELQRELQRSMRWLETAQKAASMGYFSYDLERQQFFMSSMANSIFGLGPQEYMTLRQWSAMLLPEERKHVLQVHAQAMQARSALRLQYRIRRASDGQQRWVQVWGEYGTNEEAQLQRMSGTVQDITERKQTEEQLDHYRLSLEEQVRLDALTQLANRLALDEAVSQEWERAQLRGMPLALLMIDVDHFKAYNDRYGHVAGDLCLQRVARTLAGAAQRAGELVARYGGEEFAVLLPDCDELQALAVAQRLCTAVRELGLEHLGSAVAPVVTVSIGLACLRGGEAALAGAQGVRQLFERADAALYQAKQAGRDRVALAGAQSLAPLPALGSLPQPAPPAAAPAPPAIYDI